MQAGLIGAVALNEYNEVRKVCSTGRISTDFNPKSLNCVSAPKLEEVKLTTCETKVLTASALGVIEGFGFFKSGNFIRGILGPRVEEQLASARFFGKYRGKIDVLKRQSNLIDNHANFASAMYGAVEGEEFLKKLNSLGPRFKVLLVDPGIEMHADEFLKFVKSNGLALG